MAMMHCGVTLGEREDGRGCRQPRKLPATLQTQPFLYTEAGTAIYSVLFYFSYLFNWHLWYPSNQQVIETIDTWASQ